MKEIDIFMFFFGSCVTALAMWAITHGPINLFEKIINRLSAFWVVVSGIVVTIMLILG